MANQWQNFATMEVPKGNTTMNVAKLGHEILVFVFGACSSHWFFFFLLKIKYNRHKIIFLEDLTRACSLQSVATMKIRQKLQGI